MMTRHYTTVREARGRLALDTGFDPFISGGWGRCTKAKLADAGYPVDHRIAEQERREREQAGRCHECGVEVGLEWQYDRYAYPTHCAEHRRMEYACDNGHRWLATRAEDEAADHKCPICGDYWH